MQLRQTQWELELYPGRCTWPQKNFPPKVDLYKTPEEKTRQSGAESRGSQLAAEQSVKQWAGHASFS